MASQIRRITWVHITYDQDGTVEVYFVKEKWKDGNFLWRLRKSFKFHRMEWPKMRRLLHCMSISPHNRYTLYAWNGYSVCFERRSY